MTHRLIISFVLFILLAVAGNVWAAAGPYDAAGIERLQNATASSTAVSLDRATGTVRFLRFEPGAVKTSTAARLNKQLATQAFLDDHASIFGLRDHAGELELVRELTDNFGYSHVFYRQVYQGVPVFGSDFRSHFNRDGVLTAISAATIPIIRLVPTPRIKAAAASATALAKVAGAAKRQSRPAGLSAMPPELMVFRTGLLQGVNGRNHLAYRVEVINNERSIREFVFVDAHTGAVLDQITGIYHAIDRQVSNWINNAKVLVWSEGDSLPFSGMDETGIKKRLRV